MKWKGPYRIIAVKGVNAEIREIHGNRKLKVHVNRLKACLATEGVKNQLGNVPLDQRLKREAEAPLDIYRIRDRVGRKYVSGVSRASKMPLPIHSGNRGAEDVSDPSTSHMSRNCDLNGSSSEPGTRETGVLDGEWEKEEAPANHTEEELEEESRASPAGETVGPNMLVLKKSQADVTIEAKDQFRNTRG